MISLNKYAMIVISMTILFSGVAKANTSEFSKKVETLRTNFNNSEIKKFWNETTKQENIDWLRNNKNEAVERTKKAFTQYPLHVPAGSLLLSGLLTTRLANATHLSKEDLLKRLKNKGNRNFWLGTVLGTVYLLSNYKLTFAANEKSAQEPKIVIEEISQATN